MRYKVLAGMMIVGAGCGASAFLPPRPAGTLSAMTPSTAVTGRPNNAEFRAGGLEGYPSFQGDIDAGGPITGTSLDGGPKIEVTLALPEGGGADPCAQAQADAGWSGDFSYSLYTVTASDGTDMCAGEVYHSTFDEIDERCTSDDVLDGKAIVVRGYWDGAGAYHDDDKNRYTISCTTGAVAKCVHWGYVPGSSYTPDGGEPTNLRDHFIACVRAVRASYSDREKNRSFTCNGAVIDIHDGLGIQTKTDPSAPLDPYGNPMTPEGAWDGRDGGSGSLRCLSRPRYDFFRTNGELADAGVSITDGGCDGGLLNIQSFSHLAPSCTQPLRLEGKLDACLEAASGKVIVRSPCDPQKPNAQVALINNLDGYQLQFQGDEDGGGGKKCLTVKSGAIVAEPCNGQQQRFELDRDGGARNVYLLRASDKRASDKADGGGMCLDVSGPVDGGQVLLQNCDPGNPGQQFNIVF